MGLMPTPKPQGNAAPEAAAEGATGAPVNISDERGQSQSDDESNVSPEEQELYDTFVKKGSELIYTKDGKINPDVLAALNVKDDTPDQGAPPAPGAAPPEAMAPAGQDQAAPGAPPDQAQGQAPDQPPPKSNVHIVALANTAFQIVKKLDESSREQGTDIPDDILMHGGTEIVEELGQVARAAGIHDYSSEELSGALYQAIDLYRSEAIKTGRTSEDTLKAQFGQLDEADKAGKLGDILPGFDGSTLGTPPVQPRQ